MKKTFLIIMYLVTIFCMFVGLMTHVGGYWNFGFGKYAEKSVTAEEIRNSEGKNGTMVDPSKIKKLKIEVSNGDVTLSRDSDFGIKYRTRNTPEIYVDGDTLVVSYKKSHNGFLTFSTRRSSFDIRIPENIGIENVEIFDKAGDVNVKAFDAKKLMVSSSAGDIKINGGTYESVEIDTSAGDVDLIAASGASVNVRNSAGDICVKDGLFKGYDLKTSAGNIEIKGDLSDYRMDLSTSLGDVEIDGSDRGTKYQQDGNKGQITAETSMGDVEIDY